MKNERQTMNAIQQQLADMQARWGISLRAMGEIEKGTPEWRLTREVSTMTWYTNLCANVGESLADLVVSQTMELIERIRIVRDQRKPTPPRDRKMSHILEVMRTSSRFFDEIAGREYHIRTHCDWGIPKASAEVRNQGPYYDVKLTLRANWLSCTKGLPRTWNHGGNKKFVLNYELIENSLLSKSNDVLVYRADLFGKRTDKQMGAEIAKLRAEYIEAEDNGETDFMSELSEEIERLKDLRKRSWPHAHKMFMVVSNTSKYFESGNPISAIGETPQTALKLVERRSRDEFVRQLDG